MDKTMQSAMQQPVVEAAILMLCSMVANQYAVMEENISHIL